MAAPPASNLPRKLRRCPSNCFDLSPELLSDGDFIICYTPIRGLKVAGSQAVSPCVTPVVVYVRGDCPQNPEKSRNPDRFRVWGGGKLQESG